MLTVENLAFSYKEKRVLKDISFHLERGDVFAILGKNAVGKTTLINILTGLLEAQDGKILLCGEDTTRRMSENTKTKIGVMRPIAGLFEKMTCYQYLEFVAGLYSVSTEKIVSLSEQYQFASELSRKIKNCSAGTRKKIEFCAAILHNPSILFLDEPFESVDPIVVAEIKEYVKDFASAGKSVVITSHILDIIQNLCNRCIIINDGVVVYSGEITKGVSVDDDQLGLERIFLEVVNNNGQK